MLNNDAWIQTFKLPYLLVANWNCNFRYFYGMYFLDIYTLIACFRFFDYIEASR